MGECAHHCAVPGEAVCPTCLQRKLTHVWRGEDMTAETTSPILPGKEALAVIGSIATIAKAHTRKPHPSFDAESEAKAPLAASDSDVMKDWSALQATRRSSSQKKKKSVTIIADESLARTGLPLVDRVAKETALRVIKEVGDDVLSVEESENNVWEKDHKVESPVRHWHSKIIQSKWVKGLGSPLTNSNKVFPSKSENVQGSSPSRLKKPRKEQRKRALRFEVEPTVVIPVAKVVTSESVIEGMPDEILKPEDMNQRLRTSYNTVLSWLQDLPSPQTHLLPQIDEVPEEEVPALLYSPRNNDAHDEDLTLVGHLHEIAEEHENSSEEPEVSLTNHLHEVTSFGKFLIRAAQRQPREGLSRVAKATP